MTLHRESGARYAVNIEYKTVHFEAEDLDQILASLDGPEGWVHVFDRMSGSILLDGSMSEVRSAINALHALRAANGYEMDGVP